MSLESKVVNKYPVLGSSQSPEEISLTIKGAVVVLLPLIALTLKGFGVTEEWLGELVNGVFGLVGAGIMVWGVVRKFKK
jgi:hypothetical protein